jgi:Divergent InlB B-repeat domain
MRPNKILGLAVASALAISTNLSFAGKLDIEYVDANCEHQSGLATLASELFLSDSQVVPTTSKCSTSGPADDLDNSGVDGPVLDGTYYEKWWYAKYTFDTKTLDETPFLARFELSNGVQFGKDISLESGTSLDFVAHPSGSHAGVGKSSALGGGGSAGDSQVVFNFTPKPDNGFVKNRDTLFLRFTLKNLGILKTPGEEVKLTAEVFADPNESSSFDGGPVTESVVTSARAIINPTTGTVQIDPATECTTFTGNDIAFIDSTRIKLGSILIQSTSNVLKADLSEWKFDLDTISSLSSSNPGILTITDGTFSASAISPGKVFLDLDKNGSFTSGTDIPTTTVIDNNVAEWNLTSANLTSLYNSNGADIIIEADGNTLIQGQSVPANAILQMNYKEGDPDTFSQQLIQIGSCTPSNPPPPPAQPLPSTTNLTVNFSGNGHGHVTTDPTGIDCDSSQLKCSYSFDTATWVKLTPSAAADSKFTGWYGYQSDCEDGELFMSGYRNCTASFALLPQQLTVNVTGQGSVSSNPAGLTCDNQCSHEFKGGEKVTLTVTPKTNWQFEKWQGDCDENGQVVMDKEKQCEAVFIEIPCSMRQPVYLYPQSPNFGTILVGDSVALNQSVYYSNQECGEPLYLDKIEVIGNDAAEFQVKDTQCYHYNWWWWGNQSYSSYCYFNTVFQPTTAGDKQAKLTFKLRDHPELPMSTVALQAKAVDTGQAQLEFTPTEYDFGTVIIGRGSPQPQSFAIKNTGEISLKVDNMKLEIAGEHAAEFSLESWSCNYIGILQPGAQCDINVWLSPTTVGQKQARVTVAVANLNAEALLKGIAEEPKDCSDANITIQSVQSGPWNTASTWSTATLPTATDVVRINSGHTITSQELAQIKTLCVQAGATLESLNDQGTALEIQATDYLENHGLIRGKDGRPEAQFACTPEKLGTEGCAQPGASVLLKVGTGFDKYGKMGDWWWEGSGGPILNTGEIIAGKGGDGSQYGAPGGDAIVLGRNNTNAKRIQAGDGGNVLGTGIGEGGRGGLTQIWGKLGGPGHLYVQNGAQALAGNGGNCNPQSNQQTGGNGGNLWLVSLPDVHIEGGITKAGSGGQGCARPGQAGFVQIEPNVISLAGAATHVKGGNIAIYGGNDWTLDLSNLSGTVIEASGTLTLAVGKGGLIDFRNSTGQILKAKEVQIFSDNLLIDNDQKILDYIAAENIVIGPSKILRNVSLTVAGKLFGNPGEVLSIPLVIANNGPEDDQYTITVKDSAGNILNQLAAVEVKGLETVNLSIALTIPTSNKVIFTAVSQADKEVSSTSEVILTTMPVMSSDGNQVDLDDDIIKSNINQVTPDGSLHTPDGILSTPDNNQVTSDGNQVTSGGNKYIHDNNDVVIVEQPTLNVCHITPDGIIDWICINQEQILTDMIFESNAKVSGGQLAGTIDNQGFVSQVTIQPDTILTGGKLSGYIVNQGTLMDFEFVGAQVSGGTLAGQVINNSLIGGVFKDVKLAADAHLLGGYLQGEIQGDPAAPALLEDLIIRSGSHLAYVKIGKKVTWSAAVVFEDNVQFVEPTTYCNPNRLVDIVPLLPSLDIMVLGNPIKPCSQLVGGLSTDGKVFQQQVTVTRADSVEVLGRIAADLRQVNQVVEWVLFAAYRAVETGPPLYFMVDTQGQVLPWDGEVSQLVAFKEAVRLESVQSIRLYRGKFPATGQLEIQFGYRLADGTVVLNAQPLEVRVVE